MRQHATGSLALIALLLAACGLTSSHATPVPPTSTMAPLASPSPVPAPPLRTDTGPYADARALLDGVCFEFLYDLGSETWVWAAPGDLTAFYDRADASGRCAAPVARGTFDFGDSVLAGALSVTTGCDAAHRVLELRQDDATRTQTLILALEVRSGCPYELVQPFLAAIPRPPDGYTLRVTVQGP